MRRILWTFVILSPMLAIIREDHAGVLAPTATHLVGRLATHTAIQVAAVIHAVKSLMT